MQPPYDYRLLQMMNQERLDKAAERRLLSQLRAQNKVRASSTFKTKSHRATVRKLRPRLR